MFVEGAAANTVCYRWRQLFRCVIVFSDNGFQHEKNQVFSSGFPRSAVIMSNFVPKKEEVRANLKFCFLLKKTATEAHEMLREAYGEHVLGLSQYYEWYQKFRSGCFEIHNEPRGRPHKVYEFKELETLLEEDCSQTQQQLADQLGVTKQSISLRLKSMGKVLKLGKWIRHDLTDRRRRKKMWKNKKMR